MGRPGVTTAKSERSPASHSGIRARPMATSDASSAGAGAVAVAPRSSQKGAMRACAGRANVEMASARPAKTAPRKKWRLRVTSTSGVHSGSARAGWASVAYAGDLVCGCVRQRRRQERRGQERRGQERRGQERRGQERRGQERRGVGDHLFDNPAAADIPPLGGIAAEIRDPKGDFGSHCTLTLRRIARPQ
jgi:hypothetical protein